MDLLLNRLEFILRLHSDQRADHIMEHLKRTFRGAFREKTCRYGGKCECCESSSICPFMLVFGQTLSADPDALRKYQKPPLPFVFELRQDPARMKRGDLLKLSLVLAGSATNHVQVICTALIDVFQSFTDISLAGIGSVDCSGFSNPLLTANDGISFGRLATLTVEDILAVSALPPDHVILHFLTPLCMLQDGTAIREFSFPKFITSLLRRISSIAFYYGGIVLELDYKRLSALSRETSVVESNIIYSGRTGWKKEGLVGSCVVTGDLSEFHPLLLLGEYLHCGKGAAYGMGSYEIVRSDSNG